MLIKHKRLALCFATSVAAQTSHGILGRLSEEQIKATEWQDEYAWARDVGFSVFENSEFLNEQTRHIDGSACCAMRTNPEKVNIEGCVQRCLMAGDMCVSWTWQPSTGSCWLLTSMDQTVEPLKLTRKPAIDRTSGARGLAPPVLMPTAPAPMIGSVMFRSVRDLGIILNQAGPASGVVLGVGTGERAIELLETWRGSVLYLVDPYIHIYKGYDSVENVDDREHQMRYERLRSFFETNQRFMGRYSFAREFSFSFSRIWKEKMWEPLHSFVFIDNNPINCAVERDLNEWWDLLLPGAFITGSHYDSVEKAVNEFAQDHDMEVFVAPVDKTWLMMKPEGPSVNIRPRLEF